MVNCKNRTAYRCQSNSCKVYYLYYSEKMTIVHWSIFWLCALVRCFWQFIKTLTQICVNLPQEESCSDCHLYNNYLKLPLPSIRLFIDWLGLAGASSCHSFDLRAAMVLTVKLMHCTSCIAIWQSELVKISQCDVTVTRSLSKDIVFFLVVFLPYCIKACVTILPIIMLVNVSVITNS